MPRSSWVLGGWLASSFSVSSLTIRPRGRFFDRASVSRQPASAFSRPSTAGLRLGSFRRFQASSGSNAKLDGSASRSISSSERVELAEVAQVVAGVEPVVETTVAAEHVADVAPDLARLATTSCPRTRACPEVGSSSVMSILMVVVLPRAVGPEEAEQLALADLKRHAPDGLDGLATAPEDAGRTDVGTAQVVRLDHRHPGNLPSPADGRAGVSAHPGPRPPEPRCSGPQRPTSVSSSRMTTEVGSRH